MVGWGSEVFGGGASVIIFFGNPHRYLFWGVSFPTILLFYSSPPPFPPSNHIKNCLLKFQYVDVVQKSMRNNIAALKVKTTWIISNVLSRDQVKIPVGLKEVHKEVLLTCSILF